MRTDFRPLCAELTEALDGWLYDEFIRPPGSDRLLVERARAALDYPGEDAEVVMVANAADQAAKNYREACVTGDKNLILSAALVWHHEASWDAAITAKEAHLRADIAAKAAGCVQKALKQLESKEP